MQGARWVYNYVVLYCFHSVVNLPSSPSIILGERGSTTLSLSWTQLPSDEVDSYIVRASYLGNCSDFSTTPQSSTLNGTVREFVVRDLQEFSMYQLSVIAVNSVGQSAESIVVDTKSAGESTSTI